MRSPNILTFVGLIGTAAVFIITYSPSSRSFAVEKIPILSNIQKFNDQSEKQESERQRLNSLKVKPVKNETKIRLPLKKHSKKILVYDNIKDDSNITIKVIYSDLSACEPRPEYLPQYRAHCWTECTQKKICNNPPTLLDVNNSIAQMYCFPNLHLIGLRKSGTTDFSTLWIPGIDAIQRVQQDYYGDAELCPVNYIMKRLQKRPRMFGGSLYNGGPGTLIANKKLYKNETHLMITSGIQYLGYMCTTESRFYVQLRNPTDRVISYLFHWQHEKRIPQYKARTRSDFTESFVDRLMRRLIAELKQCIARHGEVACVYMPDAHGGNLDVLLTHSLYVVYIEELFKFIPKEQVMIKTMEEYSNDRESTATEVIKQFFGVKTAASFKGKAHGRVVNRGHKNPVQPSTLQLLDEFFAPYNQRLSELLGDPKFLYIKLRV